MSLRAANPPVPAATDPALIRNFCIIAHIDHGKSTLADRMLGITGVVSDRDMRAQYLDRMDIERERGITIKSQAVRMPWQVGDTSYALNMIDTPGHVDFSYEVSRSLAACEGAILLVDAAQGIEAQTLANLYLALENDLHIIPVLNKIDLPAAQPEKYAAELAHLIGCDPSDVLQVSGKTGEGVTELMEQIVADVPAPVGNPTAPARAMIFDSVYDTYRGVVTYVRVIDGHLSPRERILMLSTRATHELLEIGVISPEMSPSQGLGVGEVGYLITGVKDVRQSKVGDTVTNAGKPAAHALAGYREPKPMVFSGLYPIDGSDYPSEDRVELRYTMPMAEIVFDFFDALKSRTRGYASLDYEPTGEQEAALVKVDILLHGEPVDAFSAIVHKDKAYSYGVALVGQLRELIPRQQFEVPIQAAVGSRIIARESIRAMRKDVLAKCYGGDIARKRNLLEKQKEGKKRMKMVGRVEVPQEAFIAALSGDVGDKA